VEASGRTARGEAGTSNPAVSTPRSHDFRGRTHPFRGATFLPTMGAETEPQAVLISQSMGAATTANLSLGDVPVGSNAGPGTLNIADIRGFSLINETGSTVTVGILTGVSYSGAGAGDYSVVMPNGCPGGSTGTITQTPSSLCIIDVYFHPSAVGDRSATMTITASDSKSTSVSLSGTGSPTLTAVPGSLRFGDTTLGTFTSDTFVLTNAGNSTDTIDLSTNDLTFTGPGADDYVVTPASGCPGGGVSTVILASDAACTMDVSFFPGALGDRSATMAIEGLDGTTLSMSFSGTGTTGYYQVDSRGQVAHMGDAAYYGDAGKMNLNKPIVGMAATGDDGAVGWWPPTVASSTTATPTSTVPRAASTSTSQSWAWRERLMRAATGS
jgi:hypothetical protein